MGYIRADRMLWLDTVFLCAHSFLLVGCAGCCPSVADGVCAVACALMVALPVGRWCQRSLFHFFLGHPLVPWYTLLSLSTAHLLTS
jgi:hypothetical protein